MTDITFWSRSGSRYASFGDLARERVLRSLERFADRVQYVRISLDDLNGPRGGVDQECRILLKMRAEPERVFASRATSAGGALAVAIGKMRRLLSRKRAPERPRRGRVSAPAPRSVAATGS